MGRGVADGAPAAVDAGRIDPAWIGDRSTVDGGALLLDVVKVFRAAPHLRMVAVVDAARRPIGAVYERDVRQLLFSPFGYALASNPSLAIRIGDRLQPCPTVSIESGVSGALACWQQHRGAEGLIVTEQGRYCGTIDQQTLLRVAAERDIANSRRAGARAAAIQHASSAFEEEARALAAGLSQASHTVADTAARMAERAQQVGHRTAAVAAATVQASANLAEVAGRTRAFAGALGEVAMRTTQARAATDAAVLRARSGAQQIDGLVEAANSIGTVTALIDEIGQRTTMVALNATIEAAREGQSARGFTAVANEVKALAAQTRTAAAGIARDVVRVRGAIGDVRAAQGELVGAVDAVDGLSAAVAEAVAEQTRAGQQISGHVAEASVATDHIRGNIDEILHGALAAGDDAGAMTQLAGSLAARADELERHMLRFLDAMAA
ncbi:methyl-accepting chemotaxis protein [Sphingomonas radiodurans]|uniref:methyl-accepting chemotaxis protein n=1 Tax=Sphingomonas radiodurans TaxID=2890321 RepID=UPI001E3541D7|nr:methyl-accepting chemotaxis protein [Sphingomonas radiodurans]WBH17875.1 methyl-accepting chemotaxis protein [Sphingomonas radiodurans]